MYLRRIGQQKSINIDYVDLDIICDGLFILSCLCELDVHRKVKQNLEINEKFYIKITEFYIGNLWLGRY